MLRPCLVAQRTIKSPALHPLNAPTQCHWQAQHLLPELPSRLPRRRRGRHRPHLLPGCLQRRPDLGRRAAVLERVRRGPLAVWASISSDPLQPRGARCLNDYDATERVRMTYGILVLGIMHKQPVARDHTLPQLRWRLLLQGHPLLQELPVRLGRRRRGPQLRAQQLRWRGRGQRRGPVLPAVPLRLHLQQAHHGAFGMPYSGDGHSHGHGQLPSGTPSCP